MRKTHSYAASTYFWHIGWIYTAFHKKRLELQLPKIMQNWPAFDIIWTPWSWLEPSHFKWVSDHNAGVLLPPGRTDISQKHQNALRSKFSLITPNCVRNCFLSDSVALGKLSDQQVSRAALSTILHSNRLWADLVALEPFMIRHKRSRSQFGSDSSALEIAWSESDFNYKQIS